MGKGLWGAKLAFSLWLAWLCTGCNSGGSGLPVVPAADWPRFRHDTAHTGQGLGNVASGRGTPLAVPVDNTEPLSPVVSSPVIGLGGTVYVVSESGTVLSVTATGEERWRMRECAACPADRALFGRVLATPTLYSVPNQTPSLWFGSEDGRLYAIEERPEGPQCTVCFDPRSTDTRLTAARFSAPVLVLTHPVTTRIVQVVAPAAVREAGNSDERGVVWSVGPSGEALWRYPQSSSWSAPFLSSPALVLGNNVLAPSGDGYLHLLAASEGGLLRWRVFVGPWVDPDTPVALAPVTSSTALFVNTADGRVNSLGIDPPLLLWQRSFAGERFAASMALGAQLLPTETPTPTATPSPVEPTSPPVQTVPSETPVTNATPTATPTASPTPTALAPQAVLFALTKDGRLLALQTRDGSDAPLGDVQQAVDGFVLSSPALSADGYLVFGSSSGYLYAIDNGAGLPAWPPLRLTQAPLRSSPAIAADGTIWIGADDGHLYRVGAQ